MNQCLRCNNRCIGTSIFCDRCQASLLDRCQGKEQHVLASTLYAPTLDVRVVDPPRVVEPVQTNPHIPIACQDSAPCDIPDNQRETPASLPIAASLPDPHDRQQRQRIRRLFIWLSIFAAVALLVDGALLVLVSTTPPSSAHRQTGPALTLSQTTVYQGQVLALHLSHCQPFAHILLSHDIQEPLHVDAPSSLIQVNSSGVADLHTLIDADWQPGTHSIQAEDVGTHFVFSAQIQVVGAGSIPLPSSSSAPPQTTVTARASARTVSATPSASGANADTAPSSSSSTPGATIMPSAHAAPALSISSSNLSFTATQSIAHPPPQEVTITDIGSGSFSWQATINSSKASWLTISSGSNQASPGQPARLLVTASSAGLAPGSYNAQISITAFAASGQVSGSPQTLTVLLTVLAPCSMHASPASLSFSAPLLQTNPPPGQSITITSVGGCARPISWTAQVDHNSQGWLLLSASSGSDTGKGSTLTVNINMHGVLLSSQGQITITAVDTTGSALPNGTLTVPVTLNRI
jgi:hypothetical protein